MINIDEIITFGHTTDLCKTQVITSALQQQMAHYVPSDGSRSRHCGIPAQFQRMPLRHESCVALCPFENLDRALLLFVSQGQWPHF